MRPTLTTLTLLAILIAVSALAASPSGTSSAATAPASKLDARLAAALDPDAQSTRLNPLLSTGASTTSTASDPAEVGVLIRFSGDAAPIEATGAHLGTIAGNIATATATLDEIADLAALPNVLQLSAGVQRQTAGDLAPLGSVAKSAAPLDVSVGTTAVDVWRNLGYDGTGVIIGIIDTGIDYKHLDFRTGDNEMQTRVLRIWDQLDVGGPQPQGFVYGTEWLPDAIETDLAEPLCPPICTVRQKDTDGHGTHVSSIAAGDGSASGGDFAGMAPNAYIVHIKSPFNDPQIIDGAAYVFQVAEQMDMPAVVNLSLGGLEGSHDGTSLLEMGLSALVGQPGRAMVVAAGNDGDRRVHAGADVPAGGSVDIAFQLPQSFSAQKVGSDLLDFWYDGEADLCLTVISPNSHANPPACLGDSILTHLTPDGCIGISSSTGANGDNEALVFVDGPQNGCASEATAGTWTIRIATNTDSPAARIDGWASPGTNEFDPPYGNTDSTVTEPGSAPQMITVGSYVTKECWDSKIGEFCASPPVQPGEISTFSGLGPNRLGDIKPDLTAPGQRIFAAFSDEAFPPSLSVVSPDSKYIGIRGTSMAAPHVAGAAALILQAHPDWRQAQIKSALINSSLQDQFTGSAGNTWGAGKLHMPPPPLLKGDLNCDDKIQSTDGLVVLGYVAGIDQDSACLDVGAISSSAFVFGDMDCDFDVDAVDALLILKHIAALPIELIDGCAPLGAIP